MPKILKRVTVAEGGLKASDLWRTPRACFDALHAEFGFVVDLAADTENHLCDVWLGPGSALGEDALTVKWAQTFGRGPGFLNPPYSTERIKRFLDKALRASRHGFTTVALVPYTPDTRWWHFVEQSAEIRSMPHRVPYLKADGVTKTGAMFPSAVVIFRPQPGVVKGDPRRVVWSWREDVLGKGFAAYRQSERTPP